MLTPLLGSLNGHRGGTPYEVAEKGNPELFRTTGGRTFMIPGADGHVVPAKKGSRDAGSDEPLIGVTINNHAPGVVIQPQPNNTLTVEMLPQMMDMFDSDQAFRISKNRGKVARTMKEAYGLSHRSTR